jgi:hypothetical protein
MLSQRLNNLTQPAQLEFKIQKITERCPDGAGSFVVSLKNENQTDQSETSEMNMDFGLFHLLIAFRSIPKTNNFAPAQEQRPSELPEIDYALLSRTLPRLSPPPKASGQRELLSASTTKKLAFNVLSAVARSSHSCTS